MTRILMFGIVTLPIAWAIAAATAITLAAILLRRSN